MTYWRSCAGTHPPKMCICIGCAWAWNCLLGRTSFSICCHSSSWYRHCTAESFTWDWTVSYGFGMVHRCGIRYLSTHYTPQMFSIHSIEIHGNIILVVRRKRNQNSNHCKIPTGSPAANSAVFLSSNLSHASKQYRMCWIRFKVNHPISFPFHSKADKFIIFIVSAIEFQMYFNQGNKRLATF